MGETRSSKGEADDWNAYLWSLIHVSRLVEVRYRSSGFRRWYSRQIHRWGRIHVLLRSKHFSLFFFFFLLISFISLKWAKPQTQTNCKYWKFSKNNTHFLPLAHTFIRVFTVYLYTTQIFKLSFLDLNKSWIVQHPFWHSMSNIS